MTNRILRILTLCALFFTSSVAQDRDDFLQTTIDVVSKKIDVEGATSEYLKIRGWAYYSLGSLDMALSDYNNAIAIDNTDDDLYFRRADVFYAMKNFHEAISDYDKAIAIAPDSLTYYNSRAVTYEEMNLAEKALSDYSHILEKDPTHEFALRNRAILLCKYPEKFHAGLADWQRLLTVYPKAEYFGDRGFILMKKDDFAIASRDFEQGLAIEPNNETFMARFAYCIGMAGNTSQALSYFLKLEQMNERSPLLYQYRSEIYFKLGNKQKGCADVIKAKQLGVKLESLEKMCVND